MIRELSAIKLETFFQLDSAGRTSGINGNSCHSSIRQHFFSERVINIWNSQWRRRVFQSAGGI